jgi:hypothetical protein
MHSHAEPVAGPSGSGTVVLELGPGVGALILHTPQSLDGAEIEISRVTGDGHERRTHSMVRPRHVAGGTRYAAVYPGVAPGDYTIWHPADGAPVTTVTVSEGAAASVHWPSS